MLVVIVGLFYSVSSISDWTSAFVNVLLWAYPWENMHRFMACNLLPYLLLFQELQLSSFSLLRIHLRLLHKLLRHIITILQHLRLQDFAIIESHINMLILPLLLNKTTICTNSYRKILRYGFVGVVCNFTYSANVVLKVFRRLSFYLRKIVVWSVVV